MAKYMKLGGAWPWTSRPWPRASRPWPRTSRPWPWTSRSWPRTSRSWPRTSRPWPCVIGEQGKQGPMLYFSSQLCCVTCITHFITKQHLKTNSLVHSPNQVFIWHTILTLNFKYKDSSLLGLQVMGKIKDFRDVRHTKNAFFLFWLYI